MIIDYTPADSTSVIINTPITNALRIRAMSDAELAHELLEFECLGFAENTLTTYGERLAWLQQPESEDDNE